MPPLYDFRCQGCSFNYELVVKYEDRDKEQYCEFCGETKGKRYYSKVPMVTKASYPDGYKRKGWTDVVTDAKLRETLSTTRSEDDKAIIHKEITERIKKTSGQG